MEQLKEGNKINVGSLIGKIVKVKPNKKIGLTEEGKREPKYDILLEDIPQSKLIKPESNGTD
jgi:hypothetical protein